jgi:hypothetical protein
VSKQEKQLWRNGINGVKPINSFPHRSKIRLEKDVVRQRKQYEKEEILSSDKWDLVDHPSWLQSEANKYSSSAYRELLNKVGTAINEAFSYSRMGVIAVLAVGICLQDLKKQYRVLQSEKNKRQWGEKRDRAAILKRYRLTEYLFDNHPDIRQNLLYFIQARIEYKEHLMRKIAEEFEVQIPLDPQFRLFDDISEFSEKLNKFV